MKAIYLFSIYPGESFAELEIKSLRDLGCTIVPARLREIDRGFEESCSDVLRFPLFSCAVIKPLFSFISKHPIYFITEIFKLVYENMRDPEAFARSVFVTLKAPAIAEAALREKIDLFHIFWGHYPSLVIPILKQIAPNIPITVFLGAYSLTSEIPSAPRVLRLANAVVTHFDGHVPQIQQYTGISSKNIFVSYRGVDSKRLQSIRGEREKYHLLIISRLVPAKAVDDGIRAFALVKRGIPELKLTIIGDGPSLQILKTLATQLGVIGATEFTGRISHSRVLEILKRARLLLLPSLSPSEFYPNAVKEAFALGVPVVAYGIEGVAAFNQSYEAVKVAAPGCIEDLASLVSELLSNTAIEDECIAAGLQRVKDFSVGVTSKRLYDFFDRVQR